MSSEIINPIPEIISDESFNKMLNEGMLTGIGIRDYILRKEYNLLKKTMSATKAIHTLCDKYFMSYNQVQRLLTCKKDITIRSENWKKYNLIFK